MTIKVGTKPILKENVVKFISWRDKEFIKSIYLAMGLVPAMRVLRLMVDCDLLEAKAFIDAQIAIGWNEE